MVSSVIAVSMVVRVFALLILRVGGTEQGEAKSCKANE